MAIYVTIYKISESDSFAIYEYGPNEDCVGQIQINKGTGEIEILSNVPSDDKMTSALCAKRKLYLHWKNKEFPDKTFYAA
ncbi:hypothetical protein F1728_06530 [Gimesia benthica]|uniref:Uncharacterized protein n=1 Tax=Gimesia benthica TaxID=2608982 RepID=A0A6I6A8J4_9PLAN|nr:hypothetical protein [Gimesia benthica]QGQ22348.1 hypothetical protein F1728_06530 [Gimesia benthica]